MSNTFSPAHGTNSSHWLTPAPAIALSIANTSMYPPCYFYHNPWCFFLYFFIFVSQDEFSAEQSTPPPPSVLFSPRTTEASLREEFAERRRTAEAEAGPLLDPPSQVGNISCILLLILLSLSYFSLCSRFGSRD